MKYLVQTMGLGGHAEQLVEREELEALLERDLRRGYAAAAGSPADGYRFLGTGAREVLAYLDAERGREMRVLMLPQIAGG